MPRPSGGWAVPLCATTFRAAQDGPKWGLVQLGHSAYGMHVPGGGSAEVWSVRWWRWLGLMVLMFLLAGCSGSSAESVERAETPPVESTTSSTTTTTTTEPPATTEPPDLPVFEPLYPDPDAPVRDQVEEAYLYSWEIALDAYRHGRTDYLDLVFAEPHLSFGPRSEIERLWWLMVIRGQCGGRRAQLRDHGPLERLGVRPGFLRGTTSTVVDQGDPGRTDVTNRATKCVGGHEMGGSRGDGSSVTVVEY
jgi:hypothetical protein